MDSKNVLEKLRTIILPQIKDWTLPYDDKRFRKDWWRMRHLEWFIFHTVAYKWVLFYINLGSFVTFNLLGLFFYYRGYGIFSILFFIVGLRMGWSTYKKLRTWKVPNTFNFYDLLFRDYTAK